MTEVFRKHYSYGETIPIIDTHVGMTADIYEVTGKPAPAGPFIKAVCTASAGPMKSPPLVVEPLQSSDSRVVHLTNIPVPTPWVRTLDISLIFDFVNYRFTQSPVTPRDNGIVTFDLRLRAAFSIFGKSYTLLLDQRPCSITLTKALPQYLQQPGAIGATVGYEGMQPQAGQPPSGQAEWGSVPYFRQDIGAQATPVDGGATDSSLQITNRLDIEERLRQLGTKLLTRT